MATKQQLPIPNYLNDSWMDIPASEPDPIPAETVARRPPAHDPCEADKQEQEDRWL